MLSDPAVKNLWTHFNERVFGIAECDVHGDVAAYKHMLDFFNLALPQTFEECRSSLTLMDSDPETFNRWWMLWRLTQ